MKKKYNNRVLIIIILFFSGCNYFTFTPRSRYNKKHEMPSVTLLSKIIEYREEFNEWPFSKEQFTSKGKKYKDAFVDFRYLSARFDIIDNDKMNFIFSEHIKDFETHKTTGKIDLNRYCGEAKFFKEREKFTWKLNDCRPNTH